MAKSKKSTKVKQKAKVVHPEFIFGVSAGSVYLWDFKLKVWAPAYAFDLTLKAA